MTAAAPWPTNRSSSETITAQFGAGRAELARWGLTTGDPLADAVVAELHELGTGPTRRILDRGITAGLGTLDDPPPAIAAFLTSTENRPGYADDELLAAGSLPFFTSPMPVHLLSLSAGSLISVYESPSIAKVLATTGRLVDRAERRIVETGTWLSQAMLPDALRPGRPGYVATLRVRMLHAHMRKVALDRGYDSSADGVPINQIDLARTWMDFTLTAFTAEDALGFGLEGRELASLYRYWWYLGHLLGIDARLIEGIVDHAGARRVAELLDAVTGPSTAQSAELAAATLDSVASLLQGELRVPPRLALPVLRAVTRRFHGPAANADLGVPQALFAERLLRPAVAAAAAARRRSRRSSTRWRSAIEANIDAERARLAAPAEATAYERGATGTDD